MCRTHLVIPDSHAHPDFNNDRADWLGKFIADIKPDVVVNLGDMWDMPSLSSYDKGKKSFEGRRYARDIEAGLDFDDRLWEPIRKLKKRLPFRVFLEGNHENRIKKHLEFQPEMSEFMGFQNLDLNRNYDIVTEYNGASPGVVEVDGVHYAHFFISGVMGRPIGGEHPAYQLVNKQGASCTAGHSHITDFCVRSTVNGKVKMGLIAGMYQDYFSNYAGAANELWWKGVIVKRNVEGGSYEPQWVAMETLKKEYS